MKVMRDGRLVAKRHGDMEDGGFRVHVCGMARE